LQVICESRYSDLGVRYDINNVIDKAYSIGRNGSLNNRIKEIIQAHNQGVYYTIALSTDNSKVKEFVDLFYNKTLIIPTEKTVTISTDKVQILSGKSGERINEEALINEINLAILNNKSITIEVPLIKIELPSITLDDIFNLVYIEPKNAEAVFANKLIDITSEKSGRTVDKNDLSLAVVDLNKTEGILRSLPIKILDPEITADYIRSNLFSSTISSASTQFYTDTENNANRGNNIRLAVAKINGTVIASGEAFSLNDVVGERTVQNGYKTAHAYSDGRIIDDVGGGICQVSTTLYNAIMYADLQITLRINHMFTVGYIPLGMDASVSFPDVDLRFINTSSLPIMIQGTVTDDNRVIFIIKGYIDNPGKTIEYYSTIEQTYDFNTEYIDDISLYVNDYYVTQSGMTGYMVYTYKIIRQNGKQVSEEKIYTSIYQPLTQIIVRGVKARPIE